MLPLIQTILYACLALFGIVSFVAIYDEDYGEATDKERSVRASVEMFPAKPFRQPKKVRKPPTAELIDESMCAHLRRRKMMGTIRERKTKIDGPCNCIVSYDKAV
ncbi:unnamed protein product [Bursaphelenchus xylophilus]|uniref:(pine wood nematode) hypothetical protein n=1 Tax=Bursaphelenchus xylophilus TaxID=6326 RepID=A0A1I7S221_BURXY|nr:unnamed protein product [Bursaphelenchus xylophilus]CAG9090316.1 unnamed protein product [Bursaphelenchus xylophilus]